MYCVGGDKKMSLEFRQTELEKAIALWEKRHWTGKDKFFEMKRELEEVKRELKLLEAG